jgi:Flp pilus assembly protein TadG
MSDEETPPPPRSRGQESQALIEFALISPLLLLLIFGIIDIGRAVFYYDTLNHAAREGARVAATAPSAMPTNASVLNAVLAQVVGVTVTEPCPQGPVSSGTPPANAAWMYVTEAPAPTAFESTPPMNAPGGEYPATGSGSCNATVPAGNNVPLEVTIRMNLVLITPVISQFSAGRILLTATAVYRSEY